ncbi:MAG: TIGR00730 family Rossman fold protein [Planctomycetota bacterium]|nr:TIGR00730 family Rossman fold protein [Planctomycetota bacterium]MDA1212222.1 TIGR00730 family Rossman fold protein [Planctomycetota bacterium]
MKRICIYCGSQVGKDPTYRESARELGTLMARRGSGLVYGGGSIGLMGVVADALLAQNAEVIGVIPDALATKELIHPHVADMRIVRTMHERKALMAELADAFIALPGGYGTFEELFEAITWNQLGLHRKPIGLLNVAGYFDPFVRVIDHAVQEGFVKRSQRDLFVVEERPLTLLDRMQNHTIPPQKPIISQDEM